MKRKKKILISLSIFGFIIIAVMAVMGISYYNRHAIKTIYCTEDYTEMYEEELRLIFGEDYQILEKKTVTLEGEDCSCGYHSDTYIYDQWIISYEDQSGQKYTQILNNKNDLENQQIRWLKEQLEQHYKKQFLVDCFEEGTFQDLSVEENGRTYCFTFLGNPVNSFKGGEEEAFERAHKAGDRYWEQLLNTLGDKENMIHLWELDYEQIFRDFPVKVSLHLSIDDLELSGEEKAEFERAVKEKTLQMIEEIKEESGYTCNLVVSICCSQGKEKLYDGESDWYYYILQGEPFETGNGNYDWKLFESYEGLFW